MRVSVEELADTQNRRYSLSPIKTTWFALLAVKAEISAGSVVWPASSKTTKSKAGASSSVVPILDIS